LEKIPASRGREDPFGKEGIKGGSSFGKKTNFVNR